ncbi:MAG: acyl-CoA dehydrogenase family protein, partial [Candidatus Eremiobacteraeota bacterium]|nr:acyl-CoA dehydrogenase family protein [Candidatus Eremiobacteraeota bacterium]
MDFDLSDEQKAIQQLCRDFAREEIAPRAEAMDQNESFPYDLV